MSLKPRLCCLALALLFQATGAHPGFRSFKEYQAIQGRARTAAVGGPYICSNHGSCESCVKDGCTWCSVDERCHDETPNFCGPGDVSTNTSACPAPVAPNTSFDLELARQLLIYSDAAYFDPPEMFGLPDGSKVVAVFSYTLGLWDQAKGFVAFHEEKKEIVVAFRGTETLTQLVYELLHHAFLPLPGHEQENALVNEFFLWAVEDVLPSIQSALDDLQCPECKLYMTGHSLGASMATLSAFRIADRSSRVPILYTFGQPRVGNAEFSRIVEDRLPEMYRVVNGADPVAHMPPCDIDPDAPKVRHGSCLKTGTGYYHAGREIWFPTGQYENNVMCGFRECVGEPQSEDWSCSDGLVSDWFPGSVFDHHGYWKVIFQGWCGDGKNATRMQPSEILV
mmetsp:Transcript_85139/g.150605  ORF Transcript_85139/g.150605 Transcript_85139/m.150605 type:complete len:395 (-) Transcript_85139:134-1318(-)|eukprot:CAMPEP_0197663912 /NCGR_PEP_ID=MMETSP1338-20131121/58315_1 /TAXON_ID=43686 ORGANISM="Pelagodinium beii, Strain RCC1491" /NCGR_SAMPLE_ID=MMETSP1338 /ASSEMBLY_ACC=CAM_ASM_000754 /LENGTH=394 /DNA_ID=CAMNT_0043242441 /DNA_START=44 /DNA_END=1228 /DNA_ORIENTATION=+